MTAMDTGLDLLTPEWSEILYETLINFLYYFICDELLNKTVTIFNLSYGSSANEKEDQKTVLGRYRSDTNLDRYRCFPYVFYFVILICISSLKYEGMNEINYISFFLFTK